MILYSILLIPVSPHAGLCGAWTLEQGTWFRSETGRYFTTVDSSNPPFEQAGLSVHVEYGLLDRLTVGVTTDQSLRLDDGGMGQQSGRIGAFGRVQVWRGETDSGAVQLGASFPFTEFQSAAAPGGDRAREFEVMGLYGRGYTLPWGEAWVEAAASYSHFDRGHADEVGFDLTAGIRPDENWVALVQIFSTFAIGPSALGEPDFDAVKVHFSAGRRIFDEKTLLLGISRDIHARGTDKGFALTIGFWTHF